MSNIEDLLKNLREEADGVTAQPANTPPDHREEDVNIREELLELSASGEIKYTEKYIKKASQDTLEKIKRAYVLKNLKETNNYISDSLIAKFSELLGLFHMINNPDMLEKDLTGDKLFKKSMCNVVGKVTSYIPMVGLLSGGITVGKHIISNKFNDERSDNPLDPGVPDGQGDTDRREPSKEQ